MNALPRIREEAALPAIETMPQTGIVESLQIRRLQGHSGATLLLYEQGSVRVVRKTAAEQNRNDRLQLQCALQRRLSSYGIPFPRVLSEGVDETGLAFFDMDYVPAGNLGASICEDGGLDRDAVVSTLDRVFRFFRLTAQDILPAAPFHAKIDQIARQCKNLRLGSRNLAQIADTAARLNTLHWDGVPSSLCHGDMTLENMLTCPSRGLVFVDCDDCFVSSYWLDAAKIFQDVAGHWCLRALYLANGTGVDAVAQRLDSLVPALRAMLALLDPQLAIRLPQFTALNLFRTLPYTKDERLAAFVLERMAHVLNAAQL
jgi:aminoglycoside phosphotransferase (APT) family kinase protein